MFYQNSTVSFGPEDMKFVSKHGVLKATELFLSHYEKTGLPLVADTTQLSSLLGFSERELFRILRRDMSTWYTPVFLPKKDGSFRKLSVPCASLRRAQTRILKELLELMPVSSFATAYYKGARLTSGAAPHIGKKYLLKIDITDFFGSITQFTIVSKIFNSKNFPLHIGAMLAKLCCLNEALPQGAPTSPAISNLVMKDFDNILGQWCNDREITYTRYCDDLTFSSDKPLGAVYKKAKSMLFKFGFEVNEKKTRFIKNTNRQSVTGITVNEKLSVSRDYKRSLRAELHAVFKFGLCDAMLRKTGEKYVSGSTAQPLRYLDSLEGKVRFVLSVEPENAYFLKALADIKAFRKEYSEKYPFDYMPFFS